MTGINAKNKITNSEGKIQGEESLTKAKFYLKKIGDILLMKRDVKIQQPVEKLS